MSWNYQEYSDGHLQSVMKKIKDKLNSMDITEAANAKIATADERGGAARGVVFWSSVDPPPPLMYQTVRGIMIFRRATTTMHCMNGPKPS